MALIRTASVLTLAASIVGILGATTTAEFRVSEPVTVPGVPQVTLGPGTYLIRPLESHGGTNVVQILSPQKDYVYTTVLTIPATRPVPDERTKVFFSEGRSGQPPALHFWFPPGDTRGYEFVSAPVIPVTDSTWRAPEFQSRPNGGRGSRPEWPDPRRTA